MDSFALKKVVLIEDGDSIIGNKDFVLSLQVHGISFCYLPWSKDMTFQKEEGTLYLTDKADMASIMATEGIPVLGCLTNRNQNAFFGGVRYLVAIEKELEPEYLERVYRRYYNLPWEILNTKRCLIRETMETDIDAFYEIYANPSITRYMDDLFPDREDELLYITNYRKNIYEFYEYGIWTVLSRDGGQVIGRAGFTMREGFSDPEIGFVIGAPWQRKGYAFEVCMAILSYGLTELGFHMVQAFTQPNNTASLGLLHKLGFQSVGFHQIDGNTHIRLEKRME